MFTTGTWMHLAATVDASGNVKMYKNGTSLTVTTTGTVSLPSSTKRNYCYVGRSNWSNDGLSAGKGGAASRLDARLSSDEISDRYDGTRVVSTTDLAGWWPLDDATGTSVRDSSGNGRTGSLSSAKRRVRDLPKRRPDLEQQQERHHRQQADRGRPTSAAPARSRWQRPQHGHQDRCHQHHQDRGGRRLGLVDHRTFDAGRC